MCGRLRLTKVSVISTPCLTCITRKYGGRFVMAKHRKQKGDLSQVHVVVERRKHVDRDMLSVALFGWLMEKLRAESTGGKHRAGRPRVEFDEQPDGDSV
jgi:hypothetical protein